MNNDTALLSLTLRSIPVPRLAHVCNHAQNHTNSDRHLPNHTEENKTHESPGNNFKLISSAWLNVLTTVPIASTFKHCSDALLAAVKNLIHRGVEAHLGVS